MQVKGKKVLVVGLARSGLAAANFLLGCGAQVTITDRKRREQLKDSMAQLEQPVQFSLGGHRLEDFLQADFIVLSPGVPSDLPELLDASRRGVPIYSEIELAYRFLKGRVIGVTGSNGKTTTTTLIGKLLATAGLECVVAGNIGTPLIQCLGPPATAASSSTTYVVELSSFQLENIEKFKCDVALMLNVSPGHQDRYPDFKDYLKAKERIFLNQSEEHCAVLNADDPHTLKMAADRRASAFLFSRKQTLEQGVFLDQQRIQIAWKGERHDLMPVGAVRLRGGHNLENILAATAAGFLSGVDQEAMAETFSTFEGVEHRLERVRAVGGITFYNDSKATNAESTLQALKAFDEALIVIMGGLDKGSDFSILVPLMKEKVKQLILLGVAGDMIEGILGKSVSTIRAQDLPQAVELAHQEAAPGDVIVLSPGCASFDMFEDFEHRGQVFKEAVTALCP
ncbi:MAG: UDP-N-acetylmuramoyl-L-alanine--D-glutamate ligase [Acidobacteriota bacterium]